MSLGKKLATKPTRGKVGPCEKCDYPDCEYVFGNYQACPRCDGKIKHTYTLDDSSWELDEDTNPGLGSLYRAASRTLNGAARWYHCQSCSVQTLADRLDVANGRRCVCGGMLYIKSTP